MIEHTSDAPGLILVGTTDRYTSRQAAEQHIAELGRLVKTLGYEVLETCIFGCNTPKVSTLIGSGQVEKLAKLVDTLGAKGITFDDELSPPQQRNLEAYTGTAVADRHEIILDIFRDHASTYEARLQVERARLQYTMPRLKRAWTHLSRQRGGVKGMRGVGETQLEVDRRQIADRIARIDGQLKSVVRHRETARSKRESIPVPTIALVGYTNAGKSSLLNALTGSNVSSKDSLFETLDPKTTRCSLDSGLEFLLTDTVGFVRKLPHDLVSAFHSTLEETVRADLLLHVVDAASPQLNEEVATTLSVLEEIGAASRPMITVYNKIDLLKHTVALPSVRSEREVAEAVWLSCHSGEGLETLRTRIGEFFADRFEDTVFRLPNDRWDLVARLHREARVMDEEADGESVTVRAAVPMKLRAALDDFAVAGT